jgi:hypothetical protein
MGGGCPPVRRRDRRPDDARRGPGRRVRRLRDIAPATAILIVTGTDDDRLLLDFSTSARRICRQDVERRHYRGGAPADRGGRALPALAHRRDRCGADRRRAADRPRTSRPQAGRGRASRGHVAYRPPARRPKAGRAGVVEQGSRAAARSVAGHGQDATRAYPDRDGRGRTVPMPRFAPACAGCWHSRGKSYAARVVDRGDRRVDLDGGGAGPQVGVRPLPPA